MTIKITKENFDKEVVASEIPVILDFYADWCGPCRMLAPIFEKLEKEFAGKMKFGKVDTPEEEELAAYFRVQGIPNMTVIHDKAAIAQIIGLHSEAGLRDKLNQILESIK